jgi:malonate-semialdehyde dehydrogenase (acetylating)/methylmalonate-semialdehyde dehydrogenase
MTSAPPPKNYGTLKLLVGSEWVESESPESKEIFDPSTGSPLGKIPLSGKEEVSEAVESAAAAFESWRNIPISDRAQYLFRIKTALENHFEELAYLNTLNHGKTLEESRGDMKRTIENVDTAISVAYVLSQGTNLDQVSPGVDTSTTKEPLGVFSIICPFNFPIMIPFWFVPYAIVLGDTVVVKPSELTPIPMQRVAELLRDEAKLPAGVFNMVHGMSGTVEHLIKHSETRGVAFVGSTPVAKRVYALAGENGKRAIVNGGAKNSIIVTPEANLDGSIQPMVSSFFGNTGQRCLAGSNLVAVGAAKAPVLQKLVHASSNLKIGSGLLPDTQMGPVVSKAARERIQGYLQRGLDEGARLVSDGRGATVRDYPGGYYLGPAVFDSVSPEMGIAKEEIFGPVVSTLQVESLDDAIDFINKSTNFGNMASIFTTNGKEAREFRRKVQAGNLGINIGVAAPPAYFPFGGMRESFFGVLHPQVDSVDFFTDRKIVISRW